MGIDGPTHCIRISERTQRSVGSGKKISSWRSDRVSSPRYATIRRMGYMPMGFTWRNSQDARSGMDRSPIAHCYSNRKCEQSDCQTAIRRFPHSCFDPHLSHHLLLWLPLTCHTLLNNYFHAETEKSVPPIFGVGVKPIL